MRQFLLAALLVVTPLLVDGGWPTATAFAQDDTAAGGTLEVAEMAFGTDLDRESRELVGEATSFPAGTATVYCRTRVVGAAEPTTITHVWYRDGKTMAHVELPVKSASWRTFSSKRLLPDWTGAWEVRVLDQAGNLLRSGTFTVD